MMLRGHLVRAEGSPSATLVVHRRDLRGPDALEALAAGLRTAGHGDVTKVAVVGPPGRPGFDMTYRFVQILPGPVPGIELRGSCGHSIAAAAAAARREGWVGDGPVRVDVLNNGDTVRCAPSWVAGAREAWDLRFHREPATPVEQLRLLGTPTTTLAVDGRPITVSAVSAGNPYLFVAAAELGVRDRDDLFSRDDTLFDALTRIHVAGAHALGWSPHGAFPKVAALLPAADGEVVARAVSVPRWHPSMALTGLICLAAATAVEGSLPAALVPGAARSELVVHTPGGRRVVTSEREPRTGALRSAGVRDTVVRRLGPVTVPLDRAGPPVTAPASLGGAALGALR